MSLPFLPGYTFPDPTKQRFQKSQALVYENGGPSVHDEVPGIGGTLLPGQEPPKEAISSTAVYNKTLGGAAQTGETVPAWVAFGSQVLRFYGYFKEPVFSSQDENYRVRNVVILFYLEDDTLQIYEPKVKNSGIPQGNFLRRHRATKDDDTPVTVADFKVDSEFTIYGRTFFITSCDKFTEEFMGKIGQQVTQQTSAPKDPYTNTREMVEYAETHRQRGEAKPEMLKLRQFLANDGHVLRFYAYWDDRSHPFGDLRNFVINYFLADDTMEVTEVLQANDGRASFPNFVRRSQIPKEVLSLDENDPRFLPAEYYYRPTDLRIGSTINILNRGMFLFDCDAFTRQWYKDNMGFTDEELAPIKPQAQKVEQQTKIEIPPPSLIGGEEDSIQSCMSLHPKPPTKDQAKLVKYAHDVLRFRAKMLSSSRVDASRQFIITFYLSDDTVQIYEPPERNSGIVAGKYLQRMKLKNPETGTYFKASDFVIGSVLIMNGQKFQILEATEYSMSFMEADPDEFPQADLQAIISNLRFAIKQKGVTAKDIFLQYSDHGKMDLNHLMQLFKGLGLEISKHEAITVMRRYQQDNDTQTFTLREFLYFAQ